jgi:hypothetical protein
MSDKSLSPGIPKPIVFPLGLMGAFGWVESVQLNTVLEFHIPRNYEELLNATAQPEVIAIQRLLTLARRGAHFTVMWDDAMVRKVLTSASIYPLLSVLLSVSDADHIIGGEQVLSAADLTNVRKGIFKHQFSRDLFSDTEMVVCSDHSEIRSNDLYLAKSLQLRPREDFETLVVDALTAQALSGLTTTNLYNRASALGVVVAELFENTDMHGRLDLSGKPIDGDSLRGVIFKRIRVEFPVIRPRPGEPETRSVDCFEISVFDSGLGYFSSYTRGQHLSEASLDEEWKVLHNCLERHYYPQVSDNRAGHRAMGLFEVLRAIQSLKARIEIRTGRLFAYRTFLDGELQAQMRPKAEFSHFAWPIPRLLDVDKMHLAKPSEHEPLIGASVRIVVPLN